MDTYRQLIFISLSKIIPFQHPGQGVTAGKPNYTFRAQLTEPPAVVVDDCFFATEKMKDLSLLGFGVCFDFIRRQLGPGSTSPGGISDHARKVTNEKNHSVPEILEVLHFANEYRVTQM